VLPAGVSLALDTATRDRQKVITSCARLVKSSLPEGADLMGCERAARH
jgi:hypothetical protein